MRRARKSINQINVVPYIDVMLVLLVIFMVTAPLVNPGEIELPSVGSQPHGARATARSHAAHRPDAAPSWIARLAARRFACRATSWSRASVRNRRSVPDQPVVIAADKRARYEDVLGVLDLLQRNGAKKVGLLARPPGSLGNRPSMVPDRPGKPSPIKGRWPALLLAIAVHAVFIGVLIFSIRWQNRPTAPVTAELYAPAAKAPVVSERSPEPERKAEPPPPPLPQPAPSGATQAGSPRARACARAAGFAGRRDRAQGEAGRRAQGQAKPPNARRLERARRRPRSGGRKEEAGRADARRRARKAGARSPGPEGAGRARESHSRRAAAGGCGRSNRPLARRGRLHPAHPGQGARATSSLPPDIVGNPGGDLRSRPAADGRDHRRGPAEVEWRPRLRRGRAARDTEVLAAAARRIGPSSSSAR